MRFGWQSAVLAGALGLAPAATLAASSCYDESSYPAVLRIEATEGGFRAYTVSPDFEKALRVALELRKQHGWRPDDPGPAYVHPVIGYSKQNGFSRETPLTCHIEGRCKASAPSPPSCATSLPPRERLVEDALRAERSLVKRTLDHTISAAPRDNDIDQDYGACARSDGSIWFGISYYDGEGSTGMGGIGHHDPKTGKTEIRRPEVLRGSSITQLSYDGEYLWLGTAGNYECTGTPPTLGLVRYHWKTDRALTFLDGDDGPCGLLVNGFVQLGDDLWIATDLGLSNWNRKTSKWKNYVPDSSASLPMRETSCPDLYRKLIDTLPRSGWNEAMPASSPYHQLIESLARLRPRAIDAATLADGLFHVFFPDGTAFNPDPGERAYRSEDFAAAFQEIKQRAETGDPQAQYNLGTMYALGQGVGRDFVQAAAWLAKAAAQGHAQAQANLGLLLLNGARTKAQWREAERWLRKASDQGSDYAKTALLLMRHSRTPASLSD
jgi:hypothetical protein